MTAPTAPGQVRRIRRQETAEVIRLLEQGFGAVPAPVAALEHQFMLDALDRGQHGHFVVWPGEEIRGVLYASPSGTVVPAGDPEAGAAFSAAADRVSWRVMVGDATIAREVLRHGASGWFRRRPNAREQRFMVAERRITVPSDTGIRPATMGDIEPVTEFASRLHVEDRMGPPISRSGRPAIRSRMARSIERGTTWVAVRNDTVVGKVDVSLVSQRRGAQIAGVYVDKDWRGQGIASQTVALVTNALIDRGAPGVTLHVRSDNMSGHRAYEKAGYTDYGPWILALR